MVLLYVSSPVAIWLALLFIFLFIYQIFIKEDAPINLQQKEYPIFDWPDVLFQEKVNNFSNKENTLPLPAHQHSLAMKCFIWGLIVCILVSSFIDPDFIINNGIYNFDGNNYSNIRFN